MKNYFWRRVVCLFVVMILIFVNSCASLRKRLGPPVVMKKGVKFRYYEPSAYRVCLAGGFNNWQYQRQDNQVIELTKNKDGLWTVVVPFRKYADSGEPYLERGSSYKYKFVINDERWEPDPNNPRTDEEDNSVIVAQ